MVDRRRILWLHTQPEHYFNCMMDDLAGVSEFEWIAAFSRKGAGFSKRRFIAGLRVQVNRFLTANRLGVAYWRYFGIPSSKITLCPYYADYLRVDQARQTVRGEVMKRINLEEGDRYFFTAARLVPA